MFEKTDNKDVYKKVRSVTILEEATGNIEQPDGSMSSQALDNNIVSMAISPSEEIVVCSTLSQQLYSITLSTADMGKVSMCEYTRLYHSVITIDSCKYYSLVTITLHVLDHQAIVSRMVILNINLHNYVGDHTFLPITI